MQYSVEIADLAEAVAAQLERGGHETEPPLADVERGAAVVVLGVIAIGNDHLRKRHSIGDGPHVPVVVVADGVQRHALAIVEADPQ